MRSVARGSLSIVEPELAGHLDRCLGCRACEPVCPSGVEYGGALEAARELMAEARPIPFIARALNAVMAEPLLLKPALFLARLIRPFAAKLSGHSQLGFVFGMLAATRPRLCEAADDNRTRLDISSQAPRETAELRATPVALFEGCVMSGLLSHVHEATERTLSVNGFSVSKIAGQSCCGALHAHAGQRERAKELARKNVEVFAAHPVRSVAVNSAGCGAMLKEDGELLAGEPLEAEALALARRVRDVSELLAERGPRQGEPVPLRVAYDPPCHLLHAQGIADPPRAVLNAVPGIERADHGDAEICCGSAGSYSFTQSALSRRVLERKVGSILAAEPDIVASGNPGCIMQIGAGLTCMGSDLAAVHPVEILDKSYARAGFYD